MKKTRKGVIDQNSLCSVGEKIDYPQDELVVKVEMAGEFHARK